MKDMQSNWIGKSMVRKLNFQFPISRINIHVYTTRPDTIFGVDFMVLAPEHEWLKAYNSGTKESRRRIPAYVKSRSERERMAEKKITGVFTVLMR